MDPLLCKIVGPDIFDDVRVHGQRWFVSSGHLGEGQYDFDSQDWGNKPVMVMTKPAGAPA